MAEFLLHKIKDSWQNVEKWGQHLASLPDGNYRVTIVAHNKRSLQQNSWFHAVLPDILQGLRDVGYNDIRTENDAKDFVKSMFFRKKVSNGTDEVEIIEGTSDQSKLNFAEKAEDIIVWAATYLNLDIAPPGEQLSFDKD